MQELYEHYKFIVEAGQSPERIDLYLTRKLEGKSRTQIQNAAKAQLIFVNDKPVKPNYKVKPFDEISVMMPEPKKELEIVAENIPLDIVYEDEDLIVINKPPGMVVHPAYGHYSGTLINALAYHLKNAPLFKDKKDLRPGLVHRIDKDTSGLLVIAKNEQAKQSLAKQFAEHTTKRKYIAMVWGDLKDDQGTITGNVGRHPKEWKLMYVYADGKKGKHAVTHYKVLKRFSYVTLVECELETGRTHQIRVHFKHIKHPLFNDAEYGGDKILWGTTSSKYKQFVKNCFKIMPRQALHAKTLGFIHPKTGKEMLFDSELPDDFKNLIKAWEKYTANRKI